jgi:nicotinamide-nucleotide amidase
MSAGQRAVSPLDLLVSSLVTALLERRETVAVAESLTAGLVTSGFGAVPGVSAVLRGGIVAYSTDLKATLLDVPTAVLSSRGAVSAEAAEAMAVGVRARCGSDWGLATTGVAGPDPQEDKPAGTVYVAVVGPGGRQHAGPEVVAAARRAGVLAADGSLDRGTVRTAAAHAVLSLLDRSLSRSGSRR